LINLGLSILSGVMLLLAFPKFDIYLFAFIGLVPLFIAVKKEKNVFFAALYGFVTGIILLGGYAFWINILSKWAGGWAYAAWASLAVIQALYFMAFAVIYWFIKEKLPKYELILAALVWTVFDWLRALGPYGVTGGVLSYTQTDFLPMLQIVCLIGSYGLTFLIVLVNASFTEALLKKNIKYIALALFLILLPLSYGYTRIASYKDLGKPINIAVIQANISQDVKLDYGLSYEIVNTHELMSRKAKEFKPDIVIWPETAVTIYLFQSETLQSQIRTLVRETNAYYLIGTPVRENEKIYNSVVAFDKEGNVITKYNKQRLVPFGEYLPLRPVFYSFLKENSLFAEDYSSDNTANIIDLGIAKVGVLICFESTLPYLVKDKVNKGAQFLVVATNDAWFFNSPALYQHIEAAQMRAVENDKFVVQAANTGISAIIDPLGRIVKRTNQGETAILSGTVFVH
jgi:apolipoprotein N-acyltransferase